MFTKEHPVSDREIEIYPVKGSKHSVKIQIPEELGVDIPSTPEDMFTKLYGVMRVMTPKDGDKRITWNNQDFAQIRQAKETFDRLVTEGLVPYRVGLGGKATSEVMAEFDPYAEEILFLPIQMVAGG